MPRNLIEATRELALAQVTAKIAAKIESVTKDRDVLEANYMSGGMTMSVYEMQSSFLRGLRQGHTEILAVIQEVRKDGA